MGVTVIVVVPVVSPLGMTRLAARPPGNLSIALRIIRQSKRSSIPARYITSASVSEKVNRTVSSVVKAFCKETSSVILFVPASSRTEEGIAVSPLIALSGPLVISILLWINRYGNGIGGSRISWR